jgi:hypothetical protein
MKNQPAATSASAILTVPDDRAAEFRAVTDGQTTSGENLLVAAYVVLWMIVFFWIFRVWRGQEKLAEKLVALDAAVERATKKS